MKTYEAREVHDWEGIEGLGDAVIIELVGIITKTRTGIHVPDTARLDVWVVQAVGPEVRTVEPGQRVMFGGQGINNVDGRVFAVRKEEDIIARLKMPELAAEQDQLDKLLDEPTNPRAPANNGAKTLEAQRRRLIVPRN
jgi:co-chaperonin GroES (HSP10)